tara:strand:+ start:2510 stop:3442 length:933 start_codon:yes stop_codon:yes gene_type:complete
MLDEMLYQVDPYLLDQWHGSKLLKARPSYADPECNGKPTGAFLKELKSRKTYFPFGELSLLTEAGIRFDQMNRPLYPEGVPAKEVYGRGSLGKWGPNHAADPIAVRQVRLWLFKTNHYAMVIQRKEGTWALPGGMVDPGETFTETAAREIREEAVDAPDGIIESLIENGVCLYRGINWSDPRNTLNAWMETCVVLFLVPSKLASHMRLRPCAGETIQSRWLNLEESNIDKLYSDHPTYIRMAMVHLGISQRCHGQGLVFLDDEVNMLIFRLVMFLMVLLTWFIHYSGFSGIVNIYLECNDPNSNNVSMFE